MRKTILKLFMMACFLAAFWSNDASAAGREFDIKDGSFYIGIKDGAEIVGNGTNPDADDFVVDGYTADHKKGYTIISSKEEPSAKTIITIDAPGKTVNLTFDGVTLTDNSQIHIIDAAEVNITLKDGNSLTSKLGHGIQIDKDTDLTFTGSGAIGIMGTDTSDAIHGGNVHITSGTVTLSIPSPSSSGLPFNGDTIYVMGGTLNCMNGTGAEDFTGFGSKYLFQGPNGTVNAAGLIKISYEDESLQGLVVGQSYDILVDTTPGTLQANNSKASIDENWFGKSVKIGKQTLAIPSRPKKPSSVKKESNQTLANVNDGKIVGLVKDEMVFYHSNTKMEDTDLATTAIPWENVTSDSLEGLERGYYYIRTRATKDKFASMCAEIYIEKGTPIEVTVTPDLKEKYGYESAPTAIISIKNLDPRYNLKLNSVSFGGKDKGSFEFDNPNSTNKYWALTINGEDRSVRVTPHLGLNARTYTASISISYTDMELTKSASIDVPIEFVVEKAPQEDLPEGTKLDVAKVTHNSATLVPITIEDNKHPIEYNYEALSDGKEGAWQSGVVFTGLTPNTEYIFKARYAGDENHDPSNSISSDKVTTDPAASMDYAEEELVVVPGRTYKITINGKENEYTADSSGRIKIDCSQFDKKTVITIIDTTNDGKQELTINAAPKAPTSPKATDETISGAKDGIISGVSPVMEYRRKTGKNTWTTWDAFTDRTLTNQAPGTYEVRTAATDKAFASKAITLIIGKGRMLDVTVTDFNDMVYGTSPVAREIVIKNLDPKNPVNIEGVDVTSNAFSVTDGAKIIAAKETSDTWKIQPKEKLNVDTYTAELTITYDDDSSYLDEEEQPDEDTSDEDQKTDDEQKTEEEQQGVQENSDIKTQAAGRSSEESNAQPRTITVPVEVKVVKAEQDAPPVPSGKSKNATSITLETIPKNPDTGAKVQYSKDGGRTWQDSPTFTGLSPNKEYTFVARYAETENYNASDISAGEIAITTDEKTDDDDSKTGDDDKKTGDDDNKTSGSSGTNGTNGTSGTNGTNGTNGTTGNTTYGANGSNAGTNGTSGSGSNNDSDSDSKLSSAKTGDLNNIQLWITLMIGSYLSCAVVIRNRLKKS